MRSVLSSDDLDRAIKRIAHEIVERNRGASEVLVIGIPTRGRPFANRLARVLSEIEGSEVSVGTLNIDDYRDDLDTRPRSTMSPTNLPGPIGGKTIVLADDVLFTGRTVRAALDALADLGRPGAVQLAVVIDRGHRQLPMRADFVGKNLPTAYGERVSVRFTEVDGEDGVWVGVAEDSSDV
ncbi:MAG: bifunctional pyr operon transcriptional regulator/uracil phosphoribosyltransferase PyrR [Actinomycetota bacterium]